MKNEDRPRFGVVMYWLAKKYPIGRDELGKPIPRGLDQEELAEYFAALSDLSIDMIERGARYHFGHSEFFPDRPAALRKSAQMAPRPTVARVEGGGQAEARRQLPMPVEEQKKRLQGIFDVLNARYATRLKA